MSTHVHSFPSWPFAVPIETTAFCTAKVVHGRFPVLQVSHDWEGDWQFLDATTEQPEDCVIVCLGCVYEKDQTLSQIADLPAGWSAWRTQVGGSWERGENPQYDESDDGDGEP